MDSEIPGWLLLLLTYCLIFYNQQARQDTKLLLALILVITAHHTVAIINAFITSTFGATSDAITFHHQAVRIVNNLAEWKIATGVYFYESMLAFCYTFLGRSLFLGEELSILAFTISCLVLIEIYKILGYTKYIPLLILVFGGLPSMVLLGSVTLRESWQILFFMLTTYFCLKNLFFDSIISWLNLVITASMLVLLHQAFVIYVFVLAGVMVLYHSYNTDANEYATNTRTRILSIGLTIGVTLLILIMLRTIIDKTTEFKAIHALTSGHAVDFITHYYVNTLHFNIRTEYGSHIVATSLSTFISSTFFSFINYLFAPFPWQISRLVDVYAALESLLRFALIVLSIITTIIANGKSRRQLSFMLFIFFVMSGIWSLGTINYGTSIRHNLVCYWILVLFIGASTHHLKIFHHIRSLKLNRNHIEEEYRKC